jgi:arsenate reductase-like glutaredoxin family protein
MTAQKNNRTKWVHLRLLPDEYKVLHNKFCKTTCRSMSEFIRAVLLDKPLVTTYRNASQDSLLEAMALLTKELNAIGNNVNQSVKRLHTLREHESASWTAKYAAESMRLEIKVNEAKALLNAIAERWLR